MSDHDDDRTERRKARRALSISEAVEQNFEFFGLFSGERINLKDGGDPLEIPHPEYLSPDQERAVSELRVEFSQYDVTRNGEYVDEEGKAVTPPYNERLCVALWGEADTKRFLAAGGRPGLIGVVWARMNAQFARARMTDSKSGTRS